MGTKMVINDKLRYQNRQKKKIMVIICKLFSGKIDGNL